MVETVIVEVPEKVTLKYFMWDPDLEELELSIIDEYTSMNPHVTIEFEALVPDEYWPKMSALATAGEMPDVFNMSSGYVDEYASKNLLGSISLAGFAFARMQFRGKNFLFGALLATSMVPIEVSIIPEFLLMIKLDWINTYLPLIVPSFLTGAYGTFMLREFFANIPRDLEDAAAIDGASAFRIYYSVFIPLAGSALVTLFVLAFINNWNALLRPVFYISQSRLRTLPLGLMAFKGAYESQWHLLLTGSVISILPLLILYIAAQRFIVEGIATTGLK